MSEERHLISVREENIFTKIRNYFKNIFAMQPTIVQDTEQIGIKSVFEQTRFFEEIRIKEEDPKLLAIQRKLENKEILLSDLSDEEVSGLNSLYKQQIKKLKDAIQNKNMKLINLQSRINEYSRKLADS